MAEEPLLPATILCLESIFIIIIPNKKCTIVNNGTVLIGNHFSTNGINDPSLTPVPPLVATILLHSHRQEELQLIYPFYLILLVRYWLHGEQQAALHFLCKELSLCVPSGHIHIVIMLSDNKGLIKFSIILLIR